MHSNGIVHNFQLSNAWKQSLIIETIAYWAVPVFFMLSGATLMSYRKKYNTKTFFKKRILKVMIPFIIWSAVTFVLKYRSGMFELSFSEIASLFINSKIEPIYWFFVPLFAVYLSIPALSCLAENRYRKVLWYMTVCALLTYSVLPLLFTLLNITYNGSLYLPITGGYVIFVLLGYLLSNTEIKPPIRYILYAFGFLCVCIRYFSTLILSINQQSLVTTFWGYTNLPSVGLAVAVFVWFKHQKWDWIANNKTLTIIVSEISSASFGIYLVHMIVMRHLSDWFHADIYSALWRTLGAVLVYVVSLVITKLLQKVPLVKYVVP